MSKSLSRSIDIVAVLVFGATLALLFLEYAGLPARIPTHFGLTGKPDRFGDKSTLILLGIVNGSTLALLSAIPFFPRWISVPGPRTAGNIARSIALVRVIKLEIVVFFAYLTWGIIQIAKGISATLGIGAVVFVAVLIGTVIIGLIKTSQNDS